VIRLRILLGIACLFLSSSLYAAPPKVNYLFPPGGQRGQTVVATAAGEFSTWPVQVWADRPGLTIEAEKDKGKFKVTIAPDAAPGVVWLRAFNDEGAASLRPFVVGTLPEIEETEPNDAPSKPQAIAQSVVVNGRLAKNDDVDGFGVELKQGQTLSAALLANTTLGSPMDAVLQVCELVERRGQTEAFVLGQNHDAVLLDPELTFTAPRDGKYLVRVFAFPSEPNSSIAFAGADNYLYRLTLTTGGLVDHALPLVVSNKQPTEVKLFGVNLPLEGVPLTIAPNAVSHVTAALPDQAGTALLEVTEKPSVVAINSSSPEQPQAVELPAVVSGRLAHDRSRQTFAFQAAKGSKVRVVCESRTLGFPLQASLRVTDASGKRLMKGEPKGPRDDTDLVFTSPADGRYLVTVADLHGRGGLRFVYRLAIEPVQPDFAVTLAADSFVLPADKPLEIPVTIDRRDGFAESIEIKAVDLPAGVTAEAIISAPQGDTAKSVKLMLKRGENVAPASQRIRIVTTSQGATPQERTATFSLGTPLSGDSSAVWLTVGK
jgi:hypothetical protein